MVSLHALNHFLLFLRPFHQMTSCPSGTSGGDEEEGGEDGEEDGRADGREQALDRATAEGSGRGGRAAQTAGQLREGQGDTQGLFCSSFFFPNLLPPF